ncbi:hypothetical protein ABIE58_001434 [Roseovarius sp. MBR-78]
MTGYSGIGDRIRLEWVTGSNRNPRPDHPGMRRLAYYNAERPHSTHGILTPDEVHASKTEPVKMAA